MDAEHAAPVTLAIPCRTDEPGLGATLDGAWASWRREKPGADLDVVVCINGPGAEASPALAQLAAFAERTGLPLAIEDGVAPSAASPAGRSAAAVALCTQTAGKPRAWSVLRQRVPSPIVVFLDADVSIAPGSFGRLLEALERHPRAALASAKTTCAPRPTLFERIMAAPYGVDFPNLSAQLYAARRDALPPAMPEDLIEPERWLELVLGRERVVQVPDAQVTVRLPATVADFFRQRIRIEMGKVQLARDYPGLTARGARQPRARAAVRTLAAAHLLQLGAYLTLRTAAHAAAWWQYRRGRVAGIWRQARTTKEWDGA